MQRFSLTSICYFSLKKIIFRSRKKKKKKKKESFFFRIIKKKQIHIPTADVHLQFDQRAYEADLHIVIYSEISIT